MAQNRAEGLNIRQLEDKEVLFYFGDDPTIDRKTGTFLKGWHSGGLEPADTAWNLNREITTNTTELTGGQTVTSHTAGAVTSSVDLIPGSPVVDHIEWPDTVVQHGTLYRRHSAKVAKGFVARIHKFGSGILGIKASREKAELLAADRNQGKDAPTRTVNITYENGADEFIFEDMYYHIGEDGTTVQVEEKVFKDVEDIQAKIKAGEAFVPQGSASGLTAFVVKQDTGKGGADLITFEDGETKPASTPARSGGSGPGTSTSVTA